MGKIQFRKGDALLIVDVQNDFCPGGALPIKEGDQVVPVINVWIQKAEAANIPVYASRDWHPKDHLSFDLEGGNWPPHCIQDTDGAEFHNLLKLPSGVIVVTKGVRFDKDQNSAFDQTGLEVYLKRKSIRRLFISGLALDVCVLATVMDARKSGFETVLIAEATRPVSEVDGWKSINLMREAGVIILEPESTISKLQKTSSESDKPIGMGKCVKAPEWAEHQRNTDIDEPCDDGRAGI